MGTILVVDDEPDLLFLLRIIFEKAGYRILEASNGAEALERVESERPDLVVTDLMMPVMDGWELIRRLRADERTATVPVIVVTASPANAPDADDILRKPFREAEVLEKARALLPG